MGDPDQVLPIYSFSLVQLQVIGEFEPADSISLIKVTSPVCPDLAPHICKTCRRAAGQANRGDEMGGRHSSAWHLEAFVVEQRAVNSLLQAMTLISEAQRVKHQDPSLPLLLLLTIGLTSLTS